MNNAFICIQHHQPTRTNLHYNHKLNQINCRYSKRKVVKFTNIYKNVYKNVLFEVNWFRKVKSIWRTALLTGLLTGFIWVKRKKRKRNSLT